MRFLLRLLISAAALWIAVRLVPGIHYRGGALQLIALALVFGVLNAIVRPVLFFFTLPLVVLTLGLFTLVLNAVVLWLTSALAPRLGIAFHVSGFAPAFWGALVVSIASTVLSWFVADEHDDRARTER